MKKTNLLVALSIGILLTLSCSDENSNTNPNDNEISDDDGNQSVNPLFVNSIVSTNIDFIRDDDSDAFMNIQFIGQEDKEMPDSRTDELFDTGTYIFEVNFSNGEQIEIWAHSSFDSEVVAQEYANKLTGRLGKLPDFMRNELSHVVLHNGDAGAFAESESNFFVIYSINIDLRISNNDLEETVFHESVHATLDADYLLNSEWLQAQQTDDTFITEYARDNSDKEDLAESALFAYTMIKNPGRLPSNVETWITTNIPNRFAFFQTIFN
ncbi:hypothetical protein [Winogradskyella sp. PE311]|uniref:hypothetical protein n=1 Tax=Winogradskyella sp. PE311 TaxID=3366943 RepID=UPI00397F2967